MFWACSFHGNSMNNLLSFCGLIDAKTRASDKDLPVGNDDLYFPAGLETAFAALTTGASGSGPLPTGTGNNIGMLLPH